MKKLKVLIAGVLLGTTLAFTPMQVVESISTTKIAATENVTPPTLRTIVSEKHNIKKISIKGKG